MAPYLPGIRSAEEQLELASKLALLYLETNTTLTPTEFADRYLIAEKEIYRHLKENNGQ